MKKMTPARAKVKAGTKLKTAPYQALCEECYEANLLLPASGLVDLTFGNVSVLDRAGEVFAIKPSGVDYQKMKPQDMALIDLEGKQVGGKLKPSSDTETHRRLYQDFVAAVSIVHTHSRHAVSFAQAGQAIPCLGTTHADYFRGEVPVTRPMTEAEITDRYEWNTGHVIVERFLKLNPFEVSAVLVHGHGPFVWGASGKKAIENAIALEIVAEMAWKALTLHASAFTAKSSALIFNPVLRDRHFFRKHGAKATYGQDKKS